MLPDPEESLPSMLQGFSWHIDNKYYSADVILCHLKEDADRSDFIPQEIEAIVSVVDDSVSQFSSSENRR